MKFPSLKDLIALFKSPVSPVTQGNNRLTLFAVAVKHLGTDASPNDIAPDEYGCAETVWNLINDACTELEIQNDIPFTLSTAELNHGLHKSKLFRILNLQEQMLEGDVLLYATGQGNGKIKNGHVFIKGEADKLMSNSSANGLFVENYTLETARQRYEVLGGYPQWRFRFI